MTTLFNELCKCGQYWQREHPSDQRCPNCNGTGRGKVSREVLEANQQAHTSIYYAALANMTDKLEILTGIIDVQYAPTLPDGNKQAEKMQHVAAKLTELIEYMGGE